MTRRTVMKSAVGIFTAILWVVGAVMLLSPLCVNSGGVTIHLSPTHDPIEALWFAFLFWVVVLAAAMPFVIWLACRLLVPEERNERSFPAP